MTSEEGQFVDGQEVRIQWFATESHHDTKDRIAGDVAHTRDEGKFTVETGGIVGMLLLGPVAVIVTPIGAIMAALTPWTNSEVQDFLRPSYTLGSDCLDHPKSISLRIDSAGFQTAFAEKDIVQKLYRGTEEKSGGPCTRVYDLGELMISTGAASR